MLDSGMPQKPRNQQFAPWRSWVELLSARAQDTPEQTAFTFWQEELESELCISYADLERTAKSLAAELQQRRLQGQPVLLLLHPGPDYIQALFACWYAGAIAVPIYTPRKNGSLERVKHIAEVTGATHALTHSHVCQQLMLTGQAHTPNLGLETIAVDQCAQQPERFQTFAPSADATALLQFTSGSTSMPKGVVLKHRQLLANTHIIQQQMTGNRPHSSGVIWLPPYHDMGLIGGILLPLYSGFPVHLMSPTHFLQRPLRWLQSITRHQATITAAPNFAYELCVDKIKDEHLSKLDLSSLTVAANGAEPIRADTLIRFADKFKRCGFDARAFLACYGMAEATLYVTGERHFRGVQTVQVSRSGLAKDAFLLNPVPLDATQLVSCGQPGPGIELQIVDPTTETPLGEGCVGEIYVQSPSNGLGYWAAPSPTAATFQNTLPGMDGEWLRTGDLGCIHKGELYVTGRIKDVIIVHGQNHYPHDIEQTLYTHIPSLEGVRCVAFGTESNHKEGIVVVLEMRRAPTEEEARSLEDMVRQKVTEHHQLPLHQLIFAPPLTIPTTSSGKVQRHKLKQSWTTQTLTTHVIREEACSC